MANQSVRFPSIAPLANQVRQGGRSVDVRTAEALEALQRIVTQLAAAINGIDLSGGGSIVIPTLIYIPDPIVLTIPITTITSPIPIADNTMMCLSIDQDGVGGRLIIFDGSQFESPMFSNISPDPLARTNYLFAAKSGAWRCFGVLNPPG